MPTYKTPMLIQSIDCIFRNFVDDVLAIDNSSDLQVNDLTPKSIKTFATWVKRFDTFSPYYDEIHTGVFEMTSDYLLIRQIKKVLVEVIISLDVVEIAKLYVSLHNIHNNLLNGDLSKMIRFIEEAKEEANDSFWEFKVCEEVLVQLPDATEVKQELYEVLDREYIHHQGTSYYFYHLLGPDKQVYRLHESFVYHSNALG